MESLCRAVLCLSHLSPSFLYDAPNWTVERAAACEHVSACFLNGCGCDLVVGWRNKQVRPAGSPTASGELLIWTLIKGSVFSTYTHSWWWDSRGLQCLIFVNGIPLSPWSCAGSRGQVQSDVGHLFPHLLRFFCCVCVWGGGVWEGDAQCMGVYACVCALWLVW